MTNREVIIYETERIEEVRQYLIKLLDEKTELNWEAELDVKKLTLGKCVEILGEVVYELEKDIHD